jgi:MFS family permease
MFLSIQNGLLNIFNFIVAIVAGFLCERVGRRRLFMISTIGMFVFWLLQTIFVAIYAHNNNAKGVAHAVIGMICMCSIRTLHSIVLIQVFELP